MFNNIQCRIILFRNFKQLRKVKAVLANYQNLSSEPEEMLLTLVDFLNDTKEFQDINFLDLGVGFGMHKRFPEKYKQMCNIVQHFQHVELEGSDYSLDEPVTIQNLYISDIFGSFLKHNLLYWINCPKSITHSRIIDNSTNKPCWITKTIAYLQVRAFINSYFEILKEINDLLAS